MKTIPVGPAAILETDESQKRILLSFEIDSEMSEVWAQIAIPTPIKLTAGDKVLAMGEDLDDLYVIGVLESTPKDTGEEKSLNLQGGTRAQVSGPADKQTIQILSKNREFLFQYDEKTGKAKVNLESGDLEFISQKGNINFYAGQDILMNGKTVGITSRSGLVLGILNTVGKIQSALTLKPREIYLQSPQIEVDAKQGDFQIEKTSFKGKQLVGSIGFVKLTMDRIESVVQTAIQKAKNVYHTVTELSQMKTGRMRTLVESTFHLKSKKVFLKAEEDVKVKGEKIHLG